MALCFYMHLVGNCKNAVAFKPAVLSDPSGPLGSFNNKLGFIIESLLGNTSV